MGSLRWSMLAISHLPVLHERRKENTDVTFSCNFFFYCSSLEGRVPFDGSGFRGTPLMNSRLGVEMCAIIQGSVSTDES